MLHTMQQLALSFLWKEIEGNKLPPDDLRGWFVNKKNNDAGKLFSFLVESEGNIEKYYTLCADPHDYDTAVLESADIGSLDGSSAIRLPFNKPGGPRSPQIGPVVKRSYAKAKGGGPTLTILNSTLSYFFKIAESKENWAGYFGRAHDVFSRRKLFYGGEYLECKKHALHEAVQIIPEKKPVFLVFKDENNLLPGDVSEYKEYLATMLNADKKYILKKAKPVQTKSCSCCGIENVTCYPAGLTKAGVNIFNIDREGAFPDITNENAYLSYAICENCADLLYIFKFHVIDKFITYIAGQETLILPELFLAPKLLNRFLSNFYAYVEQLDNTPDRAVITERKRLLKILSNEQAICTIDMIWSKDSIKGQSIGNLSGQISDVLPSRLQAIGTKNKQFKEINSAFFPKYPVEDFTFDMNLSFLDALFHRPGGKKAKDISNSSKLIELKRLIAEAVYKQKQIPENRFWEEIMITAQWHLKNLLEKDKPEVDCLYEGYSEKKNAIWMSFAGWIKHLSMGLHYFVFMGVMKKMDNRRTYLPEMDSLKKYFSDDSGINSDEKAYAFLLGILYGRVMQIQGAKGVNVGSNALTWLKRLNLSGKDLPELYIKIREKLLAYEAEGSEAVRAVIKEAGLLGSKLGDEIELAQVPCCYFLLLGQSISTDLFPKKDNKNNES